MRTVYILKCSDQSLYTWITTDLTRRVEEHNSAKTWAKYTKMRRPVELVYQEKAQNRSEASKRESSIKKLTKDQKLLLIFSSNS